jgi:hypothetical protein
MNDGVELLSDSLVSKYAEKNRAIVECHTCHTTEGQMHVQLENNHPHFVCDNHWKGSYKK